MKQIVFNDAVKLRNMIEFAVQNKCIDELARSLIHLLHVCTIGMIETNHTDSNGMYQPTPGHHTASIGSDFAPQSLNFAIFKDSYVTVNGGSCQLNGGFIYQGPGQPLDGSAPALTVSLDRNPPKHGWSIHT